MYYLLTSYKSKGIESIPYAAYTIKPDRGFVWIRHIFLGKLWILFSQKQLNRRASIPREIESSVVSCISLFASSDRDAVNSVVFLCSSSEFHVPCMCGLYLVPRAAAV